MKKILVFGMTDNPGGIESVIMNYYRKIDREKIQFDFLSNSPYIVYEDEIKSLGGKIYLITARKKNYFKFRQELKEFMLRHAVEYEAIWVNVCTLSNIDYLISAKKYGIPKRIIHCHNSSNDGGRVKYCIHQYNKKRLSKYATYFWSCSEEASPWFFNDKVIKKTNYKVIANAIDVKKYMKDEIIRKQYREELNVQEKIVIGHVGRFHFQKNHQLLIKVFKCLAERNEKYHLLLVGQGELEQEIKDIVEKENLNQRVTFLGARNDVDKIYQAMDLFMLPSQFEGLGIVALEAQAALLPCVLSDGVPEIVKVNDNVKFVSLNETPEYWANVAEKMLKESQPINKLITSEYNIDMQVKNFERELCER